MNERYSEDYRNFTIVAGNWGGYKGTAWPHKINGRQMQKLTAEGSSVAQVVSELKSLVDETENEFKRSLPERHATRLTLLGLQDKGTRPASRIHRSNFCYNCKNPVDNAVDLECVRCGWIICGVCATCGCGYST